MRRIFAMVAMRSCPGEHSTVNANSAEGLMVVLLYVVTGVFQTFPKNLSSCPKLPHNHKKPRLMSHKKSYNSMRLLILRIRRLNMYTRDCFLIVVTN